MHIKQLLETDKNGLGFYSTQLSEATHYKLHKKLIALNCQNLNKDSKYYTEKMIDAVANLNISAIQVLKVPTSLLE